jgi:hypothetical protein
MNIDREDPTKMTTHVCIYCLRDLDADAFTTEHVIPQAFGRFDDNLTLNESVCGECNQFFGDNLEGIFARDSSEAYDRVLHGLKPPAELHDLLHYRLTFALAMEGEWTGLRLALKTENGMAVVSPIPQVRFSSRRGDKYIYVTAAELEDPDGRVLEEIDRTGGIGILSPSEEIEGRLIEALARIGINFEQQGDIAPPRIDEAEVEVEVQARIDPIIRRCVAKVAFNYLAYTSGADFVRGESFHAVRSFIREGREPNYPLVRVTDEPILADDLRHLRQTDGHLITVNWRPDNPHVIAQISLFNRITYHVSLARNLWGIWRPIRCGHHFEIGSRSISKLVGTSLIVPRFLV